MRMHNYLLFLQTHPPTWSPTQAPPKMVQSSKPNPDQIAHKNVLLQRAPGSIPSPNTKTSPIVVQGSKPNPDQMSNKQVDIPRAPGSNPSPKLTN